MPGSRQWKPRHWKTLKMAEQHQDRDFTGTLGENKNSRSGTNPQTGKPYNDPHETGHGVINGQRVWINGWWKDNRKTGEKFLSLTFKPKPKDQGQTQQQDNPCRPGRVGGSQPPAPAPDPQQQDGPPPDDDVPF